MNDPAWDKTKPIQAGRYTFYGTIESSPGGGVEGADRGGAREGGLEAAGVEWEQVLRQDARTTQPFHTNSGTGQPMVQQQPESLQGPAIIQETGKMTGPREQHMMDRQPPPMTAGDPRKPAGRPLMPTVPEMLTDLAHIYRERNPLYGDNYKHGGAILKALFPDGVILRSPEEFNRMHLIIFMMGKLSRYARTVTKGGHVDSLNDLAVYAMMARECDMEDEFRRAGIK